jgi:quinol-cytochrome oxidoreductase complex cytochrome b subunit
MSNVNSLNFTYKNAKYNVEVFTVFTIIIMAGMAVFNVAGYIEEADGL